MIWLVFRFIGCCILKVYCIFCLNETTGSSGVSSKSADQYFTLCNTQSLFHSLSLSLSDTHPHPLTHRHRHTHSMHKSVSEQSFFLSICDQLPKFSFFSYVTNLQQLSRGTLLLLSLFYGKHLRIIKIEIK